MLASMHSLVYGIVGELRQPERRISYSDAFVFLVMVDESGESFRDG